MAGPEFTTQELESEEWRTIPDPRFDLYEVSNIGRVQRFFCSRGRKGHHILKQKPTMYGYWDVQLWKNHIGVCVQVHVLVALAFIGPRPEGKQVNHIDRVRSNSRATNLEYLTPRENSLHSLCNYRRGEENGFSKLTAEIVRAMRAEKAQGASYATLSRKYKRSQTCVNQAINGKTWGHI